MADQQEAFPTAARSNLTWPLLWEVAAIPPEYTQMARRLPYQPYILFPPALICMMETFSTCTWPTTGTCWPRPSPIPTPARVFPHLPRWIFPGTWEPPLPSSDLLAEPAGPLPSRTFLPGASKRPASPPPL